MLVAKKEGKACDAVLKRIEICSGATRSNLWLPEIEQVGPPVDLRVTVGTQEYAFEHTLLQPHPDSISDVATFNTIHKFISGQTPSPLPGSVHYQLRIPNHVSLPKGKKYREQALNSILEWVINTAQQLHDRRWEVPWEGTFVNNYIRGNPKDFDQVFELFRWPDGLRTQYTPGVLSMTFSAEENIEQLLKNSMSKAFARKFPKLNACEKLGTRTVLILESIDRPVGHHQYIGNVLPDLLARRTDCPDEIYLTDPFDGTLPWWIWPLKRDELHWPIAGLPRLNGSYFELGKRPPEEMSEWYRQFHFPLGGSQHIPLEWHPAFFLDEELSNLTETN